MKLEPNSPVIREKHVTAFPGLPVTLIILAVLGFAAWRFVLAARADAGPWTIVAWVLLIVFDLLCVIGLFVVQPNQGAVLQFFGKYVGTVKAEGLWWANPLYTKRHVSLRVRNFETAKLKVNDTDGNPIEIAAVVVWRVVDTAEASFQVDNYEHYVHVQSEAALRNLATAYPYDSHEEHKISLRGHTGVVAEHLQKEIQERLAVAGVDVIESRISHLAYAPEIAAAMLQRQQAGAIIAARQRIVEGAVGMVEMALDQLASRGVVEFDSDRRAAMVSNLLVVLCGERGAQPIVNTGTIYQ